MTDTLLAEIEKTVRGDLAPFADPNTEIVVIASGARSLRAEWVSRLERREASFNFTLDGGVQVEADGSRCSYSSFFAGPSMADLRVLARMMLQTARDQERYVETRAIVRESGTEPRFATDLLSHLLESPSPDLTRVVMVTGEPGAGKTQVLKTLMMRQAGRYLEARQTPLLLYVDAQGRALARLYDALSAELLNLGSRFRAEAVSVLVRLGCLVPVIDGFDELLGAGGFDDAFSSLATFIDSLNGLGQLVASARSTYFEQEFLSRAGSLAARGNQAWQQVTVEVQPWGDQEFRDFLDKVAPPEKELIPRSELLQRAEGAFSGKNEVLRRKPLFVARTVDLLRSGHDLSRSDDLVSELVRAFLERERTEKLRSTTGAPLLSEEQLLFLLRTVAEEMWNQETRELETAWVRSIPEIVLAEAGLTDEALRTVMDRMPKMAFLESASGGARVAFEHEVFFSRFLADVFEEALRKDTPGLRSFLGRGVLPPELPTVVSHSHATRPTATSNGPSLEEVLARLCSAADSRAFRSGLVRENAGRIALALLVAHSQARTVLSSIRLRHLVFPGGSLEECVLTGAEFENVEWRRLDLSRTKILSSKARGLSLFEVVIDPNLSRLEIAGVDPARDIVGLRVWTGGGQRIVFDPTEYAAVLKKCGMVTQATTEAEVYHVDGKCVELLERMAAAFRTRNTICLVDDHLQWMFESKEWRRLRPLLERHSLVTVAHRATSGARKEFVTHHFLPDQLLEGMRRSAPVPASIRSFWNDLEGRAGAEGH